MNALAQTHCTLPNPMAAITFIYGNNRGSTHPSSMILTYATNAFSSQEAWVFVEVRTWCETNISVQRSWMCVRCSLLFAVIQCQLVIEI